MSLDVVTVSVDATCDPKLQVGQQVECGQCLCGGIEGGDGPTCPVSGVVEEIRFEPGDHVFVITIAPALEA